MSDPVDAAIGAWEREHRAIDQIFGVRATVDGTPLPISYRRIGYIVPTELQPTDSVIDGIEADEYMRRWFTAAAASRDPKDVDAAAKWGPTAERTLLISRPVTP